MLSGFLEAVSATPPDFEAAQALYAEVCTPSTEEIANAVETLGNAFLGEFSIHVLAATRLSGRDDAVVLLSVPQLDGQPISGATHSLMVFENGRWVDADCEAARALVMSDG
ncbi:MAG: hypothetical protein OXL97_01150 [Chloroflexota bacterium]|nr:hypothetical protein [Chloroflexota bacterium]MDE2884340.1 hypothetical protein [Chloroflexota bacterium]